MSLYLKFWGFQDFLKTHVGSKKHCSTMTWQTGEGLTSVMGVVPCRSGRHIGFSNCLAPFLRL